MDAEAFAHPGSPLSRLWTPRSAGRAAMVNPVTKFWGEPAFCIKPSLPYLKQFTTGDVSPLLLPALFFGRCNSAELPYVASHRSTPSSCSSLTTSRRSLASLPVRPPARACLGCPADGAAPTSCRVAFCLADGGSAD
eukprot:scaffold2202_cov136-Isochrysis_galbana.AAC.2